MVNASTNLVSRLGVTRTQADVKASSCVEKFFYLGLDSISIIIVEFSFPRYDD
jgi:hypothetical protein